MNLYEASNQWAVRPPDERFFTVDEMLTACKLYYQRACEATALRSELKVAADGEEVKLVGNTGAMAKLSYWAFGQHASKAHAPASYLRSLPSNLAVNCLNHGFHYYSQDDTLLELMFHRSEDENRQLPLPHAPSENPLLLQGFAGQSGSL